MTDLTKKPESLIEVFKLIEANVAYEEREVKEGKVTVKAIFYGIIIFIEPGQITATLNRQDLVKLK